MPAETSSKDALEEEALVWDSGLSKFLGRLEEDLIRWHSEERLKAKERQIKGARALKDFASAEKQVNDAPVAKVAKLSESEPWNVRLEAIVQKATVQREEMREMLDLLKDHASSHLADAGGSALVEKMPLTALGSPLSATSDETVKLVKSFLDLVDGRTTEALSGGQQGRRQHRNRGQRGGAGEKAAKEDDGRMKRNGERRTGKPKVERPVRGRQQDDMGEDYYSESRSRTPPPAAVHRQPQAAGARPNRREPRPSIEDEDQYYSYSDESRSPPRRGAAPGGRRDDAGRGARVGGGRGRGGGAGPSDVGRDIDKFIRINRLDSGRCGQLLRDLSPARARHVMGLDQGGEHRFELSGDIRDPTAVVVARIRKAQDGGDRPGDRGPARGPDRGGDRGGGGNQKGSGRRQRSRSCPRSPGRQPRHGQRRDGHRDGPRDGPRGGDRRDGPRGSPRDGPRGPHRGRRDGSMDRRRGGRNDAGSVNQVPLGRTRDFPVKASG